MSSRTRGTPVTAVERRNARQHARGMQRQRELRRRHVRIGIGAAIAVAVVAIVGIMVVRASQGQPGRAVPLQGNQHIGEGEAHVAYNTKPATSGPHWSIGGRAPAPWGISKEPLVDEVLLHNLEHGGIGIHYNCRECPELVTALEDFYQRYSSNPANRLPLYPGSTKLIVSPYYDMPSRITLTAWGRIDTLDNFDEERIRRFVDAFRDKGPEKVP